MLSFLIPSLLLGTLGCSGTNPTMAQERALEFSRLQVPDVTAPNVAFRVAAYYGRGVCDESRPVVSRTATETRIALVIAPASAGQICTMQLVTDSVVTDITPPFELPHTVRFARGGAPDSVRLVRAP
ncbi:MAG: hypothetical protein V4617_07755 [Gemmatimonadota bacterium]